MKSVQIDFGPRSLALASKNNTFSFAQKFWEKFLALVAGGVILQQRVCVKINTREKLKSFEAQVRSMRNFNIKSQMYLRMYPK